eukprot:5626293-Amphidinium_carterae.1
MHVPDTLLLSTSTLIQPKTPTQSKRGGRAKAFFLMQTERQGVSRPDQGPPCQSLRHNGEPVLWSSLATTPAPKLACANRCAPGGLSCLVPAAGGGGESPPVPRGVAMP